MDIITFANIDDEFNYIDEHISTPALYEMLAEEATELAQASLKMARAIRGENPTPVTTIEAFEHLQEEWNDVYLVTRVLSLTPDYVYIKYKVKRWIERLKEKETKNGDHDGTP